MAKLIVVIVSWNTCELTRNCLRTLYPELIDLDNEVWVVDNGSYDGSVEMLKREFPQARLIENRENRGFARANNQILRKAKGDFYLLLNTDTIIPGGSIVGLYNFMEKNPQVGAAGPRLKNRFGVVERPLKRLPTISGELRYCMAFHFFPFNGIFSWIFGRRRSDWRNLGGPTRAEVLSAACLIIRREVLDKVGLLAEEYFLFSEENDYFFRMRQAGLAGFYLPDIDIIHLIGMSRKKRGRINSEINFFRSRKLFYKKFHNKQMIWFKTIYYSFFMWSYLVAKVLSLRPREKSEEVALYRQLLGVLWGNG
jgi:GT2 family glycosyltransferase